TGGRTRRFTDYSLSCLWSDCLGSGTGRASRTGIARKGGQGHFVQAFVPGLGLLIRGGHLVVASTMKANVVLTRPQGKNAQLASRLAADGWQALALPALTLHPLITDAAQLPAPDDYDLVVIVSSNAVKFYLDLFAQRGNGDSWPARTLAATVGHASARPLYDSGLIPHAQILHPDAEAQGQDSEALWVLLQPRLHQLGRVLIVRGESGREWLGAQCEEAGSRVQRLGLYGDRK